MSRFSPSSIALLAGGTFILVGSLYLAFSKGPSGYLAFSKGPSGEMPALSENQGDSNTASLPAGFLGGAEPTPPRIDLTLDHVALSPSGPLPLGETVAPRAGASNKNNLPASSVRVDLAPQRFSDDEIVVKPYVGVGVDVDGAGADGGFLGVDGLAADLKGKAEIGSKIEITQSLEMRLGYEVNETLGSTGGATSSLDRKAEERVQGGLSLKF